MKIIFLVLVNLAFTLHAIQSQNREENLREFNQKVMDSFSENNYKKIKELLPNANQLKEFMKMEEGVSDELAERIMQDTKDELKQDYDKIMDISKSKKINWSDYEIETIKIVQDKMKYGMPYQKIKVDLKNGEQQMSFAWTRVKMGKNWQFIKIDTCSLLVGECSLD